LNLVEDLDVYAYRKGWPRWAFVFIPIFYPSTWPIIAYRYGSWVVKLRTVLLKVPLYIVYFFMKRATEVLTTIEISEHADIGPGLFIAHIGNIVIVHHSKIGSYASMHQGVTVGGVGKEEDLPIIGDRVYFGAGAKILGAVKIGNDVVIGANAVVTRDVQDNAVVGGIPAEILGSGGSKDFVHYRTK